MPWRRLSMGMSILIHTITSLHHSPAPLPSTPTCLLCKGRPSRPLLLLARCIGQRLLRRHGAAFKGCRLLHVLNDLRASPALPVVILPVLDVHAPLQEVLAEVGARRASFLNCDAPLHIFLPP